MSGFCFFSSRRRHTRLVSDWSSDVCSSDLLLEGAPRVLGAYPEDLSAKAEKLLTRLGVEVIKGVMVSQIGAEGVTFKREIGRASCRERVEIRVCGSA